MGPAPFFPCRGGPVSLDQGQGEESEGLGPVGWASRPRSCVVVSNRAVALLCRGVSEFADLLLHCVTAVPVLSPVVAVGRPHVSDLGLTGCSSLTGFLRGAGKLRELTFAGSSC